MIGRVETFLRSLRRFLSRSVWLARLLHLPASEGALTRPGLVMIQIDGLSQAQLELALDRKELPFLKRLMTRDHYHLYAHYSGLPSTTPAIQAELFYGIKSAVPAFSFRDHESHRILRMYEPDAAAGIEARLATTGHEPLLKDGSAYSDIYVGGAAEAHFCPSSMGWGAALRGANPFVFLVFLLSNVYSLLRIVVLASMELGLAVIDFVRGLTGGKDFVKELKFIPTRAAISILLRELCVIGGKVDVARGLPIVHINFLGYDEQAHRRGPHSLFAHWTLKGIDDAIARLWHATNHSPWRHYDVWIYSDHGQADVQSYHDVQGYTLEKAVAAAFEKVDGPQLGAYRNGIHGIQTQRARFLGGTTIQRLFSLLGMHSAETSNEHVLVVALGPLGHVYSPRQLSSADRDSVAHELVHEHNVPVVLNMTSPGVLRAWTETGELDLPQDIGDLFGADHPFLDLVGEDLLRLCSHPDAGDFVLLGWCAGLSPISFAVENGAHAGISPEETNSFALLPADAVLPEREHAYLRPDNLREAALHYLNRPSHKPFVAQQEPDAMLSETLRVVTYNVHACIGMDGKLNAERIARVIARTRPDVVALQELDMGRPRSQGMDQAQQIAQHLAMEFQFNPAISLEEEKYGDAILTRLPHRLVKAGPLPGLAGKPNLEPRGALWVTVDLHGTEVQVITTHLGLNRRERVAQVKALLGKDWLGHNDCHDPVILCGDFNAVASSSAYRRLRGRLNDAQKETQNWRSRKTFPTRFPLMGIDHIFISNELESTRIDIPDSEMARTASDHLPLVANLRLVTAGKKTPAHHLSGVG